MNETVASKLEPVHLLPSCGSEGTTDISDDETDERSDQASSLDYIIGLRL